MKKTGREKAGRKRLFVRVFVGVVFLLLLWTSITAVGIVGYGKKDEKVPCDAAIVLGAGTWNGTVSAVYRERINHGVWLYENGFIKCLILTGGFGEGNPISDASAAKQYATSQGVPEDAILIEERSTITEENLEYAKAVMDGYDLETVILVSDPLHMKRAMLMAEDYGIRAYSSPTPTTMYRSTKTKLPFLARELFFYMGYSLVRLFR